MRDRMDWDRLNSTYYTRSCEGMEETGLTGAANILRPTVSWSELVQRSIHYTIQNIPPQLRIKQTSLFAKGIYIYKGLSAFQLL